MAMFNLVAADLKRMKKEKSLLTILIINVVLILLLGTVFFVIKNIALSAIFTGGFEEVGLDGSGLEGYDFAELNRILKMSMAVMTYRTTLSIGSFGFLMTLSISIFIGMEFSLNTIRNKIVSGNSRTKIFMSTYVSALIIGLIFYVVNIVAQFIISTLFFGFVNTDGLLIKTALLVIPPYMAIIAITCFVSVTLKSRLMGILINIIVIVFLPSIFDTIASVAPNAEVFNAIIRCNPYTVLSELLVYETSFQDVGRLIKYEGLNTGLILRAFIVPPFFVAAFCALGAWLFNRADIK